MSTDSSKRYEKIEFLGEGQFAVVFKARDTKTNNVVAVKKIKLGSRVEAADGINRTALREIKLLQELSHPNIIGLLDVFGQKSNVSLVFDFMETDLEIVIKDSKIVLTAAHIKSYMLQTLKGLEFLHALWILHRDMKPNNLLINEKGVLKIGDFGLAKYYGSPSRPYSHQVVTRWYRCPELLFGAKQYNTGVDIWAVGCILGELLTRLPLFPGETDLDQLNKIFMKTGTPTQSEWPHAESLPDFVQFKKVPKIPYKELFIAASDDLLDLIERLLALNPLQRCTASEASGGYWIMMMMMMMALKMPYFSNKPYPAAGHQLPKPSSNKIVIPEVEARRPGLKRKQNSDQDRSLVKRLVF
ncbi:Cyclin-Dependent Kinase 7 [Nucella lapillus]